MIFLFAGTSEGRQTAKLLQDEDKDFLVFVTTGQGAELLQKEGISSEKIHFGPLDAGQIEQLIDRRKPVTLIDATHPYAVNISKILIELSRIKNLNLIRIERPELYRVNNELITVVPDVRSAALIASNLGQTIFLTIGSKAAGEFAKTALPGKRKIVTRVMPSEESVRKCVEAGFASEDIITGYGPFSLEDNKRDFHSHRVDVIVTKDSGAEGGLQEKIDAALQLDIKVVLIQRPPSPYSNASSKNITIISTPYDLTQTQP